MYTDDETFLPKSKSHFLRAANYARLTIFSQKEFQRVEAFEDIAYIRSTTGADRLTSLALLHIHPEKRIDVGRFEVL